MNPAMLLMLTLFGVKNAMAAEFPLNDYLEQVKNNSFAYKAEMGYQRGAQLKRREADLLSSVSAFSNLTYGDDKKPPQNPGMGDETEYNSWSLGVQQQTKFGLGWKLSQSVSSSNISNASTIFVPQPEFVEARSQLELTMPLWRNWMSAELKAQQKGLRNATRAAELAAKFKQKMLLVEAEITYWRLSGIQYQLQIQRDNLARADRLVQWAQKRVNNNLADRGDLLQAQSLHAVREIELRTSQIEARSVGREFNSKRGQDASEVTEVLFLPGQNIISPKDIKRTGEREDLVAQRYEFEARVAQANLSREKLLPQMDFFSTLALNGRDGSYSESMNESFDSKHPTVIFGLRLTVPLDLATLDDTSQGYRAEAAAIDLSVKQKALDAEILWKELNEKLVDLTDQLARAQKLEQAQKAKLDYERRRLENGRSLTSQVIQFETDLATAQSSRLQFEIQMGILMAQLKSFGESI